jgi:hypothetical protein
MKPGAEVFERFVSSEPDVADLVTFITWGIALGLLMTRTGLLMLKELPFIIIFNFSIMAIVSFGFIIKFVMITRKFSNHQIRYDLSLTSITASELLSKTLGTCFKRALLYHALSLLLFAVLMPFLPKFSENIFYYLDYLICFSYFSPLYLAFLCLNINFVLDLLRRQCLKILDGSILSKGYVLWIFVVMLWLGLVSSTIYLIYLANLNQHNHYIRGTYEYYLFKYKIKIGNIIIIYFFIWCFVDIFLFCCAINRWRAAVRALYQFE